MKLICVVFLCLIAQIVCASNIPTLISRAQKLRKLASVFNEIVAQQLLLGEPYPVRRPLNMCKDVAVYSLEENRALFLCSQETAEVCVDLLITANTDAGNFDLNEISCSLVKK